MNTDGMNCALSREYPKASCGMTVETSLTFTPVDLKKHFDHCVRFSMDASVCSFGSAQHFVERAGEGAAKYLQWLRELTGQWPGSVVHVWQGERIVGQVELSILANDPTAGYVNLLYVVPQVRRHGLGRHLETYAQAYLSAKGCRALRLSVHPDNTAAWQFYRHLGWEDLGRREGGSGVHLLQKHL